MIVGEFVYDDAKAKFKEVKFEKPETELHFGDIKPSEFKIYKIVK